MSEQFRHLLSPISIGNMWLKNRMVMSPVTTAYCDDDQMPNKRLLRYLEERAKGGVGLIIVELTSVDDTHRYMRRSMSLGSDRFIEAHRRITDTVHQYDCKLQLQISHTGPDSVSPLFGNSQPVGPSVSVSQVWGWPCRQLDVEELPAIARQFGDAARRAKAAGYDGVEVHAAHCHNLLASFLSPLRNRRTDGYSAYKAQSRIRFIKEVLQQIKLQAGEDFPVTLSVSGYERFPGGRSIDDTQQMAPELVNAGADGFRVSGGVNDVLVNMVVNQSTDGVAVNAAQSAAIKHVVDVPVMVVGNIHNPIVAERLIAEQQTDLVAMARPLLADPQFPKKVMRNRIADIRHCISCGYCIDSMKLYDDMSCAVNPLLGRENELSFQSLRSKKVLVIGAGAAGMEAARLAALAGHTVVLVERLPYLGGTLVLASIFHRDNGAYLRWLKKQIVQLPIEVYTGTEATFGLVLTHQPDAVIVATGASVSTPDIPGVELTHVVTGSMIRQLITGTVDAGGKHINAFRRALVNRSFPCLHRLLGPQFLRRIARLWLPVGKHVVIIGANLSAIVLAQFLAERGKRVHIIHSATKLIPEVGKRQRIEHMDRLDRMRISVNTAVTVLRIEKHCVIIRAADREREVSCDSVVVEEHTGADTRFAQQLQQAGFTVHAIGDCTGPGLIAKATRTAAEAVSRL